MKKNHQKYIFEIERFFKVPNSNFDKEISFDNTSKNLMINVHTVIIKQQKLII